MHGFLTIDKPAGITSHDVVARIRRLTGIRRVGHAGTLDPAATGVLVLALGAATRLIEYVQEETNKAYDATIRLGITTSTDDAEGEILAEAPLPALDMDDIQRALALFVGEIQQVPPIYSALHHQGRRLHEIARAGETVELAARPVRIDELTLLGWEAPLLAIAVICGKGTYIRSLARDLGQVFGCGGHLAALRRTAVGSFPIAVAIELGAFEQLWQRDRAAALARIVPPAMAVADWPSVTLDPDQARLVRNGMPLAIAERDGLRLRAHLADGTLLALLARRDDLWKPDKVFDWN